jgi:hypothetical protein
MKNNYLKKIALAAGLAVAGSFYHTNLSKDYNPETKLQRNLERMIERDQTFNKRIQEQSSDEISAPQYRLDPEHCSQYARLSAKRLFDKEYIGADAWNLRYKNKVAHHLKENEDFKELITNNILRPGMMVGVKQPNNRTSYENKKDLEGNKAKYTHVILYVGLNDSGEPEFIHQYGRKKEKITEKDFEKRKLTPKEIITTKNDNIYFAFLGKLLDNSL